LIDIKKDDSFSIKNVVAISGSPRGKDSFTEMYLSELLKDVNKNVNISRFILSEMNIKSCLGCCKCWSILAGKCCIVDDMKIILEKIKTADLIIYAFPLYIYNVPGIFKNFLDRQLVLSEPFMAKNGNKTSHPHVITKPQKFFVLSHCGFPENIHFEGIKKIFSLRSDRSYSQLIGFLTISAGSELIKNPTIYDEMCKKIDALNAIGRQLIDNGTINSKMAKIVSKEISNKRKIAWRIDASEFWQNKIDTGSSDY
jgi:putative NADPH-quinone reductase